MYSKQRVEKESMDYLAKKLRLKELKEEQQKQKDLEEELYMK